MTDPLEYATNLALKTGELLTEFYDPAGIQATTKPDLTVVTAADFAADQLITQNLQEDFPQDNIISEESSHFLMNPQSPTWVIDPLDGTTNFSLGLAIWGISIARLVGGMPQLGVAYFPLLHELYTTQRNAGAFLNQSLVTARAPDPDQPMSFFACCSRTFRKYDVNIPYKPRILGSAVYSFCMVARGNALLGLDVSAKAWDLAAAWLLVTEAGGVIEPFESLSPFPIAEKLDYRQVSFPTLAAATPELFEYGHSRITKRIH